MELRDKNGLTEAEFLAQYKQKDYPKPSLTADVVMFRCSEGPAPDDLRVLLVRRGGHPFLGCWAFPGGFVGKGETADAAAARELEEETGVAGLSARQLGLYSAPGRDPRGWTVSEAYTARLGEDVSVQAGDDAADARWFDLRVERAAEDEFVLTAQAGDDVLHCRLRVTDAETPIPRAQLLESEGFAFDHAEMLADAFVLQTTLAGWSW